MATANAKTTQLVYLGSLFNAVNKSCREMKNITYTSGDSDTDNDRDLNDFQLFLCKLAQICDTSKGGDTITALVALKDANGPRYLFASNNRNEVQLQGTETFIRDLLDYVGINPENLGEKPMHKKVLWRILDFNFPRVEFYLKQVVIYIRKCSDKCHTHLAEDGECLPYGAICYHANSCRVRHASVSGGHGSKGKISTRHSGWNKREAEV